MPETQYISQELIETAYTDSPNEILTQELVEVAYINNAALTISQELVEVMYTDIVPHVSISQVIIEIMYYISGRIQGPSIQQI